MNNKQFTELAQIIIGVTFLVTAAIWGYFA